MNFDESTVTISKDQVIEEIEYELIYDTKNSRYVYKVKFTSPFEVTKPKESIVCINDKWLQIDIGFYEFLSEISGESKISFSVD